MTKTEEEARAKADEFRVQLAEWEAKRNKAKQSGNEKAVAKADKKLTNTRAKLS